MKIRFLSFFLSIIISFIGFSQGNNKEGEDKLIYNVVDNLAYYSQGKAAMMSQLGSLTYYPQEAKINNEEGHVRLRFIVEKDGRLSNIEVVEGVSKAIDNIAVEAIKNLKGNWISAKVDSKSVRTYFYLALPFYPKD